jgi:hypothetical protein
MHVNKRWQVVAGAGTAAAVLGLGGVALAGSGDLDLRDRSELTPVELRNDADRGDPVASADSPAASPFDSVDSAQSAASPVDSVASAQSADSPDQGDSPDAASAASPADSPDSPGSADSGDSAGSADSAD